MSTVHWTHTVHHDGSLCYVTAKEPIALGATVTLRLRTGADCPVERIFVRTNTDGEQQVTPMRQVASDAIATWWHVDIQVEMMRNNYRFLLLTAEGSWWLTAAGVVRYTPTDATDFRVLATTTLRPGYMTASSTRFSPTASLTAILLTMCATTNTCAMANR